MPAVLLVKSASTNKRGEASSGPHAHRLDEATDMGDPFVELAAEIEHLVGEAKAQVIRAEDMELLAQRRQVVFPGEFGAAAELPRVQQKHARPFAVMLGARLEVMRPDPVDADVMSGLHSGSPLPRRSISSSTPDARMALRGLPIMAISCFTPAFPRVLGRDPTGTITGQT